MLVFRNAYLAMVTVSATNVALCRVVTAVNAAVDASESIQVLASGDAATATSTA
jgi:hypothetical protein